MRPTLWLLLEKVAMRRRWQSPRAAYYRPGHAEPLTDVPLYAGLPAIGLLRFGQLLCILGMIALLALFGLAIFEYIRLWRV